MDVVAYNRQAWNTQVERGNPWTRPVDRETIVAARSGDWSILLTSQTPVPRNTTEIVFQRMPASIASDRSLSYASSYIARSEKSLIWRSETCQLPVMPGRRR